MILQFFKVYENKFKFMYSKLVNSPTTNKKIIKYQLM